MTKSFRNSLLLGSALVALSAVAFAGEDPLLPAGATAPVKGKELILPPILNEAPSGAEIALPAPGKEAELGRAAVASAKPVEAAKAGVGGPELSGPPTASSSLAAATSSTTIAQTDAPLTDVDPIGEGDQVTAEDAPVLAGAGAEPFVVAQNEPRKVINEPRVEAMGPNSDWNWALMGAVGYGDYSGASQPYLGVIDRDRREQKSDFDTAGLDEYDLLSPIEKPLFYVDRDDEVVTVDVGLTANIEGHVEPLIGPKNAVPFVSLIVGGYQVEWDETISSYGDEGGEGGEGSYPSDGSDWGSKAIFVPGVGPSHSQAMVGALDGGENGYDYDYIRSYVVDGYVDNVRYRGDQDVFRAQLLYGEKWNSGDVKWMTFGGFGLTLRDHTETFDFDAYGRVSPWQPIIWDCDDICPIDVYEAKDVDYGYHGQYRTDLDIDTYSFMLGFGVALPLDNHGKWSIDGYARASYDITEVEGTDSLEFYSLGETDGINGYSKTVIRHTDESLGYGLGAGVSHHFTEKFSMRLGVDYRSTEASPVLHRDGINPTHVTLEREDIVVGVLSASVKF